jgi:hypothetical protein
MLQGRKGFRGTTLVDGNQKKDGPKGVRTLDLHNAIVALSQIELWALVGVACHPLIARNGRTRRSLLDSTAQLPDEFGLCAHRGHPHRACTLPGSLR